MSPLDIDTALDWRGRTVVDRHGDKIGTFEELYLDHADRPAWAAVTTGLFGLRQTFVPLEAAQPAGDGLQVPFDKDRVKDAPNVDPDAQLSADEEEALFRHYGLGDADGGEREPEARQQVSEPEPEVREPASEPEPEAREEQSEREAGAREPASEPGPESREEPSEPEPADDERGREPARSEEGAEMIRSEEEVSIGTQRRVSGRARLKKYVVTEHVQKTVPVQREKVRVEFDSGDEQDADTEPPPQSQG